MDTYGQGKVQTTNHVGSESCSGKKISCSVRGVRVQVPPSALFQGGIDMVVLAWCVLIGIPALLLWFLILRVRENDGCAIWLLALIVSFTAILLVTSAMRWAIETIF